MKIEDLKSKSENNQPMTIERAFTICELIAYRARDEEVKDVPSWRMAHDIAEAIREVARSWKE
jgi:hypothetical protein